MVGEQNVHSPEKKHNEPERKTKAAASKTNPGAVARGDKLVKERPDLPEKVNHYLASAAATQNTLEQSGPVQQFKADRLPKSEERKPKGLKPSGFGMREENGALLPLFRGSFLTGWRPVLVLMCFLGGGRMAFQCVESLFFGRSWVYRWVYKKVFAL